MRVRVIKNVNWMNSGDPAVLCERGGNYFIIHEADYGLLKHDNASELRRKLGGWGEVQAFPSNCWGSDILGNGGILPIMIGKKIGDAVIYLESMTDAEFSEAYTESF